MTLPTRASLQRVIIAPVRFIFVPIRSVVVSSASVLDLVLDEIYWRFDLWSVMPTEAARGVADYSKVRGFVAFWLVVLLDVLLFVDTKSLPSVVALLAPISLLAYSLGERVFIAFLKAMPGIIGGWRGKALEQSVDFRDVDATPGKAPREDDDAGA